jgi:hypothetical protein
MAKPKPTKHQDDKNLSKAGRNSKAKNQKAAKGGSGANEDTENQLKKLGKLFGL